MAMTIEVILEGKTFMRDGVWVAKAPKFGVFAYADTEEEANARVYDAIEHLIDGVADEAELIERLNRSDVKWGFRETAEQVWERPALIRTDQRVRERSMLSFA